MAHPIWKDYYVDLNSLNDFEEFRILCNGEVIYTGKAYRRPDSNAILIRINEICADYLKLGWNYADMPTFEVQTKYISVSQGFQWNTIDSVTFLNDWSYDYNYDPTTMGMAFPVNGILDRRQWVLYTAYDTDTISVSVKVVGGGSFKVFIPLAISDDFNEDFNLDFSHSLRNQNSGTAVFDMSNWGEVESITIGDKVFKVVDSCSRYVLYYTNAYGGWDSLLIEGNYSETDNLTRHTRETEYDNRNIQNRGVYNYANEISKTITLHTSWLSDDESSRMHHLLNSTNVYLGDIRTGEMIPVIITDTITEHKTYKGNGGKLVNYAINVSVANNRVRR